MQTVFSEINLAPVHWTDLEQARSGQGGPTREAWKTMEKK